jgi:8-oxo-dGTP pyrophosphatase MutT (NUDIX family)
VVGTDGHLPVVPASRLTPQALRERFASPPAWEVEFPGDTRLPLPRAPAAASVLVPIVAHPDGLRLLLTQRTDHLRDHAGQISFPGGRRETHDADAIATALRETEEEVGLSRGHVDVIGTLPIYTTVTAFQVTPVVALVTPGFALALDPFEVAEAFEVPLSFLMNPTHHQRHVVTVDGVERRFVSMPWNVQDHAGKARQYFIWGATAAMLRNLYRFLSA